MKDPIVEQDDRAGAASEGNRLAFASYAVSMCIVLPHNSVGCAREPVRAKAKLCAAVFLCDVDERDEDVEGVHWKMAVFGACK